MAILSGKRLGPYEILSAIGAGGMGEVYRARDTRLDRTVAVKILPDHLSDRAELRERFEREARTVASLNHPHICTLHDIGQQDGTDYLVMEYLEGETLAERLKKGPLPLDQVLQYAIEISDALDKAHRKGITHRDLKPGNIMLTKSGTKLLDFGLAKLKQEASPVAPLSQRPTADSGMTAEGTILGTLQYMAPEQVEGKTNEIDARTDIFAFGVVVYEMATGKKAFEGKTQASLIAKILETEPAPMSSLKPMTPPALDRVVKRCLAKEPDHRWQTARDLCEELKWIAESKSQTEGAPTSKGRGIGLLDRRAVLLSLGTLLIAGAITSLAMWRLKSSTPQPITRTVITLPPGQQLAGLDRGPSLAISPDGTYLVYVGRERGIQQLYLRSMNGLESKPIPGTEGAVSPFFSPNSQWLAFFAEGKLKKVSVGGGPTVTLGDAVQPEGGSWGSQGTIAFAPTTVSPLQQMSDAGGSPEALTRLEKGEFKHLWPEFLPDGKGVLFTVRATVAGLLVAARSPRGERKILVHGGAQPRYAPSGHLVYAQNGSLMAVPVDPQRLAVKGTAVPVVDSVLQLPSSDLNANYSFSASGTLVYVLGEAQAQAGQRELVWVDRKGAEQPLAAPTNPYATPRLSPDGRRIAVSSTFNANLQGDPIWLYDISRGNLTRFTFQGNLNQFPTWTPDGKRIAFDTNQEGPVNLFWQLADGNGGLERLTTSEFSNWPTSFTPDGQLLSYVEGNPTTGWDIWVLRLSDRKAQPFVRTPANEGGPRFSPDGRWMAYASDESGPWEVYVQQYPGPGGKWQISTGGGTEPLWNPNGREIFYRSDSKMMAVDVETHAGFTAGSPHKLFEGPYQLSQSPIAGYDVSNDGQRFLMIKAPEQASSSSLTQIVVVQNWFDELKQKVPTGTK